MRILHVIHSFPPRSHGGTETYVRSLATAQAARGDEPAVLSGDDGHEPPLGAEPIPGDGFAVERLPAPPDDSRSSFADDPAARAMLVAAIGRMRPDVVHLHHWHNVGYGAVGAANTVAPVVVSLHDLFVTCPLFFRLPAEDPCPADLPRHACVRCLGRYSSVPPDVVHDQLAAREAGFRRELLAASAVLTLSESQRRFLVDVPWLAGVPMRALPLPPPTVPSARSAPSGDGSVLRLVSWGSLVRGKGLHVAVQAAELLGSPQRVSIDHFGRVLDSVHARDLQQLARRVRLRLHGAYGEHDMAVAFPAFDLAVFPSLFLETHGMVVDEAMALGLPVVVSDRGAPPARIGARGRVFPPGNAAALAAILQEFLDRPELLLAMRAAAPPPAPTMAEHCAALRGLYEAVSR